MKSTFFILAVTFLLFGSCDSDDTSKDYNQVVNLVFNNTKVTISDEVTTVYFDNTKSEPKMNQLHVYQNVSIINGEFKSKIDQQIWFIPFKQEGKPVLLNSSMKSGPDVEMRCDCSSGSIGPCDLDEQVVDGNHVFTCQGGCTKPDGTGGQCNMTVVINEGHKSSDTYILSNGLIISSKELKFNNQLY